MATLSGSQCWGTPIKLVQRKGGVRAPPFLWSSGETSLLAFFRVRAYLLVAPIPFGQSNFFTRFGFTCPPACENMYWLTEMSMPVLYGAFKVNSMTSPGINGLR